jgi:hypothetical protein
MPEYVDWVLASEMDPAFEYLARVLRLLQWKDKRDYWNLKHPLDTFAVDALLRVFPRGTVLWTHRDPARTIPSACSLLTYLRGGGGDKSAFARYILEMQAKLIDLAIQRRDASPDRDRVIDVRQPDLARDPVGTIREAYRGAGLPFTRAFETALVDRLRNRPRGQHGRHDYEAEDFGLDPDQIRGRFATYIERFDVPLED